MHTLKYIDITIWGSLYDPLWDLDTDKTHWTSKCKKNIHNNKRKLCLTNLNKSNINTTFWVGRQLLQGAGWVPGANGAGWVPGANGAGWVSGAKGADANGAGWVSDANGAGWVPGAKRVSCVRKAPQSAAARPTQHCQLPTMHQDYR